MTAVSVQPHLVIACGGSGGHFYPSLAVAREFAALGGRVTLLLSGKHVSEQSRVAATQSFASIELAAVRLPDSLSQALLFPGRLLSCIMQARAALKALNPDILLGMGSFAAVPACLALPRKQLPLVLHEGNSFMGKANRWLAWKAEHIALSLPLRHEKQLRGRKSATLGMPLRQAIIAGLGLPQAEINAYLQELGLCPSPATILVFGGSQGASFINELLRQSLSEIARLPNAPQFIHLSGSDDNLALQQAYAAAGLKALVKRSETNIEKAFRAASLVLCRSGASSICELALYQKPLILIPLPSSADDHQRMNAEVLLQAGAAKLLPQAEANADSLTKLIADWQNKPEQWQNMGARLSAFAHDNAAGELAELLWKTSQIH